MSTLEELLRGAPDVGDAATRASERAVATARALGLTDVSYAFEPSPVGDLPTKQRAAVLLRFAGDLAYREIGEATSTSEEAARRNVHEGLKKLREVWQG